MLDDGEYLSVNWLKQMLEESGLLEDNTNHYPPVRGSQMKAGSLRKHKLAMTGVMTACPECFSCPPRGTPSKELLNHKSECSMDRMSFSCCGPPIFKMNRRMQSSVMHQIHF
jgi:hypothetical protein